LYGKPAGNTRFGEVLRHEPNNPLTGILGNAELLLAELRRRNIELPQQTVLRLETIATLAVRMRETVHRLSEYWETQSEHATEQLEAHPLG
jgi:signal transduction histidine kinase